MAADPKVVSALNGYESAANRRRSLSTNYRRLLAELQEDARLSLAELGRRVGLSAPAVAERVAGSSATASITGYRAEVDPRALGYALGA